jgi:hypothetical protein
MCGWDWEGRDWDSTGTEIRCQKCWCILYGSYYYKYKGVTDFSSDNLLGLFCVNCATKEKNE